MPPTSSLHEDARLLDALERAQLRCAQETVPDDPQVVLDRLTGLCERHGLEASPDILQKAVQDYLSPASPLATIPEGPARSPAASVQWRRPQTLAEWQAALSATAEAMNAEQHLELFRMPLAFGLFLGVVVVACLHTAVAGLCLDIFTLAALGVWTLGRRRLARRCQALKHWLPVPVKDSTTIARQARQNLTRARDREDASSIQRWRQAAANQELLATLAASDVPLLAGDVYVLDANANTLPLSPEDEHRAAYLHLLCGA